MDMAGVGGFSNIKNVVIASFDTSADLIIQGTRRRIQIIGRFVHCERFELFYFEFAIWLARAKQHFAVNADALECRSRMEIASARTDDNNSELIQRVWSG